MKRSSTWPLGRPDSPEYHAAVLKADELAVQLGSPALRDEVLGLMARGLSVDQIRAKLTTGGAGR